MVPLIVVKRRERVRLSNGKKTGESWSRGVARRSRVGYRLGRYVPVLARRGEERRVRNKRGMESANLK